MRSVGRAGEYIYRDCKNGIYGFMVTVQVSTHTAWSTLLLAWRRALPPLVEGISGYGFWEEIAARKDRPKVFCSGHPATRLCGPCHKAACIGSGFSCRLLSELCLGSPYSQRRLVKLQTLIDAAPSCEHTLCLFIRRKSVLQ